MQDFPLLEKIQKPSDLRKLRKEQLPELCQEIRKYELDILSENPGHLGSSLGTVELSVALHYVFNTPYDRLVWDVGHQAYTHKILTGRRDKFKTLRKWNGISGFPSPKESEYDTFPAGHASNSISAALGMAVAAQLNGEPRNIVAIIGDGSMTGGLAFEGLNNASSFPNNMLVILNDNNMAIDANVGGLNKYFVDLCTSQTYNSVRFDLYKGLKKVNLINEGNRRNILRINNSIKSFISNNQSSFFDGLSLRYFGPIDGNDIDRLIDILLKIKKLEGPKILHIRTKKGKGYPSAEKDPITWHAPGKFNVETSERLIPPPSKKTKFQDIFGYTLVELADLDKRVVGITPAMPTGCSMTYLMEKYPERSFDVGIAEAHAVTFAAGLAKEGLIPFCNIYSSFAQRSYDQIIHDVCLANYPVIFCLDRAGLVGEDGATHHGTYDLAFLNCIPNITIAAPRNEIYLRNLMYTAYKTQSSPFAIRYPRGYGEIENWKNEFQELPIGKGEKLYDGADIAIISIGTIASEVAKAIDLCKEHNITPPSLYDMIFLKPLDTQLLDEIVSKHKFIITIEDGSIHGGLGSSVLEFISEKGLNLKCKRMGIPDEFIEQGTPDEQKKYCKMDALSIFEQIKHFRNL